MSFVAQAAGWLIILLILIDVFLTVLYARAGSGLLSSRLNEGVWRLFRSTARVLPRGRDQFLSFAGPIALVTTGVLWIAGLVLGFALIVWPALGTGIQASQGPTPTSFGTALYFSGYGLTTLGTGDIVPKTDGYRLLLVVEAALGFSVLTLSITYFLSVYSALVRRNTFALRLHHRTHGTGDAARLLAHLGLQGDFTGARQDLSTVAGDLLNLLESHHFYPVLHYFRFQQSFYALPRMMFVSLNLAALIKSVLDQHRYRSLIYSAAVTEAWSGGLELLHVLSEVFLPSHAAELDDQPSEATIAAWRQYHRNAVAQLQAAGINTCSDIEASFQCYAQLRQAWEPSVRAFAAHLAYPWQEIVDWRSETDGGPGHEQNRS